MPVEHPRETNPKRQTARVPKGKRAAGIPGVAESAQAASGGLGLLLVGIAQHVAAPPHRLDVVLAAAGMGQLLAQLADEDVEDLQLGLVLSAIEG